MARRSLPEAAFFPKIPESPLLCDIRSILQFSQPHHVAANFPVNLYINPKVMRAFALAIEAWMGVSFVLAAVVPPKKHPSSSILGSSQKESAASATLSLGGVRDIALFVAGLSSAVEVT